MNLPYTLLLLIGVCAAVASCTTNYYVVPTLPSRLDAISTIVNHLNEVVVVQFESVEGRMCPARVVPGASTCPERLADPQTICRSPDDPNVTKAKRVTWEKDANAGNVDFDIEYKNKNPCKDKAKKKECDIESGADLKLPNEAGAAIVVKYDVTSPGCKPLDPYIIIMR